MTVNDAGLSKDLIHFTFNKCQLFQSTTVKGIIIIDDIDN